MKEKKYRYNPETHDRRSIRLKGHDYAGGGAYFVTICAHRDAGAIFADASVKKMVERVWEELPHTAVGAPLVGALLPEGSREREGTHEGRPYVVMPDHFHGIIQMKKGGGRSLGHLVGAFKSLVVQAYIAEVKAGRLAPFPGKIWHRNYYERIIWSEEELAKVENYIRTNPWRLVMEGTHEGCPYRAMGNPNLLNYSKIGMLCSRKCRVEMLRSAQERASAARDQHCFISGFHSPPEMAILGALLQSEAKLICCPAWGIDTMKIPADWLPALEQNRMLILEMKNAKADLMASRDRNVFVMRAADQLWMPQVSPNGMLARLIDELDAQRKIIEN